MKTTSFPKSTEKRRIAADKARNRGEVAKEWLMTHTLDQSNLHEFKALMKQADKNFILKSRR